LRYKNLIIIIIMWLSGCRDGELAVCNFARKPGSLHMSRSSQLSYST